MLQRSTLGEAMWCILNMHILTIPFWLMGELFFIFVLDFAWNEGRLGEKADASWLEGNIDYSSNKKILLVCMVTL
jgi:hypothetical protein